MDVVVHLRDVADFHVCPGRRHDLHHADRADWTRPVLIQPGLLVALRRHQEIVELVLVAVLSDQFDRSLEPRHVFPGRRALRVPVVLQVLRKQHVPLGRALRVPVDKRVQLLHQLRAVLSDHHGRFAVRADRRSRVDGQIGEDLFPQLRDLVVDDRHRRQARVDHLEDVFVGEDFRSRIQLHGRLAGLGELLVEQLHVLGRDVRLTHVDFFAAEIFDALDRRDAGSGDDDRRNARPCRLGEIDRLLPPGGRELSGRHDVASAIQKCRDQLVVCHRDEDHVHANVLVRVLLVQISLEDLKRFVDGAALRAFIDEVIRLRVGREHSDEPALDHRVEIAGPFRANDPRRKTVLLRVHLGLRARVFRGVSRRGRGRCLGSRRL